MSKSVQHASPYLANRLNSIDQTLAKDLCEDWDTEGENDTDVENPVESEVDSFRETSGVGFVTPQLVSIKEEISSPESSPSGHFSEMDESDNGNDQSDEKIVRHIYFRKKRYDESFDPRELTSEEEDDTNHYSCHFCFKVFVLKEDLKNHVRTDHKKDIKMRCDSCSIDFSCKKKLYDHMDKHENERPAKCDLCFINFKSEKKFAQHVLSAHFGGSSFVCEFCERMFRKKDDLLAHKFQEHANTDYRCEDCGAQYFQKSLLVRHIKRMHSKQLFTCRFCENSFTTRHHLTRHTKTHCSMKPRTYVCSNCDAQFTFKKTFALHKVLCMSQKLESFEFIPVSEDSRVTGPSCEIVYENTEGGNVDSSNGSLSEATTSKIVYECRPIKTETDMPENQVHLSDKLEAEANALIIPDYIKTYNDSALGGYILAPDSPQSNSENIHVPIVTIVPDHTIISDHLYKVAKSTLAPESLNSPEVDPIYPNDSDSIAPSAIFSNNNDPKCIQDVLSNDSVSQPANEIKSKADSNTKMLPGKSAPPSSEAVIEKTNDKVSLYSVVSSSNETYLDRSKHAKNSSVSSNGSPAEDSSIAVQKNSNSKLPSTTLSDDSVTSSKSLVCSNRLENKSSSTNLPNTSEPLSSTVPSNFTHSKESSSMHGNPDLLFKNSVPQTVSFDKIQPILFENPLNPQKTKIELPQKCIKALRENVYTPWRHKKPRLLSENITDALAFRLQAQSDQSIYVENFACKSCGEEFAFKYDLMKHLQFHSASFKCDQCEAVFAQQDLLAKHTLQVHFRRSGRAAANLLANLFADKLNRGHLSAPPKHSNETYTCNNCNAKFGFESELFYHLQIHGDNFKCNKCKASFKEKSELAKHLLAAHF